MKPTSIGLLLLVYIVVFVVSCDEVERHNVMTFFFDGVPSLKREGFEETADANSQEIAQMRPKPAWYVHEPRKDCTVCHGKRRQRGFSSRTYLTAPVPELCYDCHTDYTASGLFVHGPVAVGQCLFCHNPHKSRIEHLLKEPEPKLCYLCHDMNTIELIPAHLPKQLSSCTDCHNAHASSLRVLLTVAASQSNGELDGAKAIGEVVIDYIQLVKKRDEKGLSEPAETTDTTVLESKSTFEVFQTVSILIEQGELQKAKAYLEEFKDNNALTDEEREKIEQVLKLMDTDTTKTEQHLEKVKQGSSTNEEKSKEQATKPEKVNNQPSKQKREIAELYYRSIAYYRRGRLVEARDGFIKVLKSDLIPAPMAKTIGSYLVDIDNTLARREKPSSNQ
ncbi:MAG: cytochrome c3 family protein [Planctomycetota bacterium]|jgi:predicted CXXCH cytochrome family protein